MRILKNILTFYFINSIVCFSIFIIFNLEVLSLSLFKKVSILALFPTFLGQVIGYLVFITAQESKKKEKVIAVVSTICSILFGCSIFSIKFSERNHQNNYGNIESNNDYFQYWVTSHKKEKRIAFDRLCLKFRSPNDLKLIGSLLTINDTLINGNRKKVFHIKFRYAKKNKIGEFKAELDVLNEKAECIYFDRPLEKIDRYESDSSIKRALDNLKQSLDQIPESSRNEIQNDFREVLK